VLSISCMTLAYCVAVGQGTRVGSSVSLTTQDGGAQWRVVEAPAGSTVLDGIVCNSRVTCVAVGSGADYESAIYVTLDSGGHWVRVTIPATSGALEHLACPSQDTCFGTSRSQMFVTTSGFSTPVRTLPLQQLQSISDISCPTVNVCEAVGVARNGTPVAVRSADGGQKWHRQALPPTIASVKSVECPSGSRCILTGFTRIGGGVLIETGDSGQQWAVRKYPGSPPGVINFTDVTCASARWCEAIAVIAEAHSVLDVLLGSRTGGVGWKIQARYQQNALPAAVSSLSCQVSGSCIAVGAASATALRTTSMGRNWRWTRTTSIANGLESISCAALSCVAVGQTLTVGSTDGGATWTNLGPLPDGDRVDAVVCTSSVCTAVGAQAGGGGVVLAYQPQP
jgi:hypothetical protein